MYVLIHETLATHRSMSYCIWWCYYTYSSLPGEIVHYVMNCYYCYCCSYCIGYWTCVYHPVLCGLASVFQHHCLGESIRLVCRKTYWVRDVNVVMVVHWHISWSQCLRKHTHTHTHTHTRMSIQCSNPRCFQYHVRLETVSLSSSSLPFQMLQANEGIVQIQWR